MYIFYGALLICIFVFFWQVIYNVVITYSSNATKSAQSLIGNLWFICLLIINITIILFIYLFYNNKITTPGKAGIDGNVGFAGLQGEPCDIKNQYCNSIYV